MNARKARVARQAAAQPPPPRPFWISWRIALVAGGVAALIGASFVVPGIFESKRTRGEHAVGAMGVESGAGLPAGSAVPGFSERDVETGDAITSKNVFARRTLLFFSEGVMCQACFEQIKGLEQFGAELDARGIRLVSVTPDSPNDLRQAVSDYGITTPMISDENRDMSEAFNTLGRGMHGDTPGHAFVLVDGGKVIWSRDYWLAPTRSMYVDPEQLLADLPA